LIVQADLIDLADGSQLWGDQSIRKLSDIFAMQEAISREISDKLRFRLTNEEQKRLTKRYTENPEAYRLYLKGRYYWNKTSEEAVKKAIEYFQQALDVDPVMVKDNDQDVYSNKLVVILNWTRTLEGLTGGK
jgi:hypothetical protein